MKSNISTDDIVEKIHQIQIKLTKCNTLKVQKEELENRTRKSESMKDAIVLQN